MDASIASSCAECQGFGTIADTNASPDVCQTTMIPRVLVDFVIQSHVGFLSSTVGPGLTVGSKKKLEDGCSVIYAGSPSFFGLELQDGYVPTFWASTVRLRVFSQSFGGVGFREYGFETSTVKTARPHSQEAFKRPVLIQGFSCGPLVWALSFLKGH